MPLTFGLLIQIYHQREPMTGSIGTPTHKHTRNLGGYYQPAIGIIVRDILDLIADIESVIRDIIELVIAIVRLIRCSVVAIFRDEKIQQFERPQTSLFARQMSIFSKRERIDDLLLDSTTEEPELLLRCIKREGNQITPAAWYFPKFFYYWAKIPARGIALIIRIIVSIVRAFTSSVSLSIRIDHHVCYVIFQILSEKAGIMCQETCGGVSERFTQNVLIHCSFVIYFLNRLQPPFLAQPWTFSTFGMRIWPLSRMIFFESSSQIWMIRFQTMNLTGTPV